MDEIIAQVYYHVVFFTEERRPVLFQERRQDLYTWIWGIHRNLGSRLHRIGGTEDHIHILVSVSLTRTLEDYVQEVKAESAKWIKAEEVFPDFIGWREGYGAFSVSREEIPTLSDYIINQPEYHRRVSTLDEYKRLLTEAGIDCDEQDL